IPYVVLATAASMNGYASNNIAPSIRGIKRVIPGTVPETILAVPSILARAPYALTASGLGDVLAKPVSVTDWKLNQLLFGDYYCPLCARLIADLEPSYMGCPEKIQSDEPAAMEALFLALVYSGVSMTMAGTSSPASGGEHMISHALDITAPLDGVRHDYHGRQVGLGTIFACALYERLFALERPSFCFVTEPTDAGYWRALSPVVEEEHALKRTKAEAAVGRLRERPALWDEIRAVLKPMARRASEIKDCLHRAGAAHRVADIGCTRERFLAAALHAHQMRERYTVIDLARAAGLMPRCAAEIMDEYL
ncbi:MAG: iron-containing alcohol dehydrogenase, partial [Lentisphaerae bacterium]|nr:iron-containing alcohol dehydrogenase [Lentisphaerota bacterium]